MPHAPTVYFTTPGELDLRALTIMGLSAKETDNPIGEFGTGFKYALATLLRTGHHITIRQYYPAYGRTEQNLSVFELIPAEFRGKTYKSIKMTTGTTDDSQPERELIFPFTTDLGPKWEPWMAYRELACNTLDEKGHVSHQDPETPALTATVISVSGPGIWSAYLQRDSIILEGTPIAANSNLEIHPGQTHHIFYRNVRVFTADTPFRYTFNFTPHAQLQLTEDRTISNHYSALIGLARGLYGMETDDRNLVDYIVHLHKLDNSPLERHIFDQAMAYNHTLSKAICKFIEEEDVSHLHPKLVVAHRKQVGISSLPEVLDPTEIQTRMIEKVWPLLKVLGVKPFYFAIAKLEPNVLGAVIERIEEPFT